MGLFDWFAADIACPRCGARPKGSTGAQTKLHPSPRQNYLEVGSSLPVTESSAADAGYVRLHPDRPFGPTVRILQTWECGSCEARPLWLEVTVTDGVISAIAAAAPDAAAQARADLVDGDDHPLL